MIMFVWGKGNDVIGWNIFIAHRPCTDQQVKVPQKCDGKRIIEPHDDEG